MGRLLTLLTLLLASCALLRLRPISYHPHYHLGYGLV